MTIEQEYYQRLYGCKPGDLVLWVGSVIHQQVPRIAVVESIDCRGVDLGWGPVSPKKIRTGSAMRLERIREALLES